MQHASQVNQYQLKATGAVCLAKQGILYITRDANKHIAPKLHPSRFYGRGFIFVMPWYNLKQRG